MSELNPKAEILSPKEIRTPNSEERAFIANSNIVKLADIEREALALTDRERASLTAKLLGSLPAPGTDVSDEEVEQREQELDSGRVAAISHEKLVRRVRKTRSRQS